jgi:hypothetical protein
VISDGIVPLMKALFANSLKAIKESEEKQQQTATTNSANAQTC